MCLPHIGRAARDADSHQPNNDELEGRREMRTFSIALAGAILLTTAHAQDDSAATVALINSRLAADPFHATDGYAIAMPAACIVELIPLGSRLSSRDGKQRIALHTLDRSAAERLDWSDRASVSATWVHLVGRPERSSKRKGFPATPDMNEKGFPKDDEAMLSYGIQLRFGSRESAREVAQAFVHLAALCTAE
jgi:hypothetical protein